MIERLIYTALKQGIAALKADPEAIVRLFCTLGLEKAEAREIKKLFELNPPNVIHNYPRSDATFPLYAVVLGDESETIKALDDFGGFISEEQAALMMDPQLQGTIINSSIYSHQHHVMVYTEHPDQSIYYYQLAKLFLTRERDYFKTQGVLEMSLRGREMHPDSGYAPEWLFVRQLTMSSSSEWAILDDDKLPTLQSQIGGAFVNNPDAAVQDVIGVTPKVTTYTENEDD